MKLDINYTRFFIEVFRQCDIRLEAVRTDRIKVGREQEMLSVLRKDQDLDSPIFSVVGSVKDDGIVNVDEAVCLVFDPRAAIPSGIRVVRIEPRPEAILLYWVITYQAKRFFVFKDIKNVDESAIILKHTDSPYPTMLH